MVASGHGPACQFVLSLARWLVHTVLALRTNGVADGSTDLESKPVQPVKELYIYSRLFEVAVEVFKEACRVDTLQ